MRPMRGMAIGLVAAGTADLALAALGIETATAGVGHLIAGAIILVALAVAESAADEKS